MADVSAGLEMMAALVMDDGSRWGDTAAPFQWADVAAILDVDAPVRQHFLVRPRGGRKTSDLAALLLVLLATQAPAMSRSYVGASDEDQAAELIDAAAGIVARTPGLGAVFRVTGLTIVHLETAAKVVALPADASAMGKRAWLIVLDEVTNWPDTRRFCRFWGVLTSGSRKVAECRTVVITNAGWPDHWVWKRREVARTSEHWRLHEVPGPLPWLTEGDVEVLRENAETPSEFERLTLNLWTTAEDRLASREDVQACATLPGPLDREPFVSYVVTLDLATVKDNAVVAVMHRSGRGVVVDRLRVWSPTKRQPVPHAEVERHVQAMVAEFRAPLVFDPAEARGMAQRLRALGVRALPFNFTTASVGRLGLVLFRLLADREIALPPDEDLVDELATVRLRQNAPGSWRLDHDAGRHDDRAVAIALGAQYLLEKPAPLTAEQRMRASWQRGQQLDVPMESAGMATVGF